MVEELPEHVRRNRESWDASAADYYEIGRRAWQSEPSWGIWSVPDTELNVLPDDLSGVRLAYESPTRAGRSSMRKRTCRPAGHGEHARLSAVAGGLLGRRDEIGRWEEPPR